MIWYIIHIYILKFTIVYGSKNNLFPFNYRSTKFKTCFKHFFYRFPIEMSRYEKCKTWIIIIEFCELFHSIWCKPGTASVDKFIYSFVYDLMLQLIQQNIVSSLRCDSLFLSLFHSTPSLPRATPPSPFLCCIAISTNFSITILFKTLFSDLSATKFHWMRNKFSYLINKIKSEMRFRFSVTP